MRSFGIVSLLVFAAVAGVLRPRRDRPSGGRAFVDGGKPQFTEPAAASRSASNSLSIVYGRAPGCVSSVL